MRILTAAFCLIAASLGAAPLDLTRAAIVVRPGELPAPERTAARVLVEEIASRTGLRLPVMTTWPVGRPVIAITTRPGEAQWGRTAPRSAARAEGFRLLAEGAATQTVVWIAGVDARGALFGVGHLLRQLEWRPGALSLAGPLDVTTSPASPIRGHQIGYRTTANSWDAWTVAQFETYIRELALFGANSIENIPSQDERLNPVMKVPRREMNRAMSEICKRYGLDYWMWTPATVDLRDKAKRDTLLKEFEEMFGDATTLAGVFIPGGDPGSNAPDLVLALMEDLAPRLKRLHPGAKLWVSLQGFNTDESEVVYQYLDRGVPEWFGGIVAGPSSPAIPETRRRLPARVGLRLYPDVTHNKISQYEVPEWDQAYALTLGREAVNPRAAEYAVIHNRYAALSDGFISYSDGVHDDVNKNVWSALGWDASRQPREILIEYCRLYFGLGVAVEAADAILALERNWRGPVVDNGGVDATLDEWQRLERRSPQLAGNWRWQMCLLRANYDAYVRHRRIQAVQLESDANAILAGAGARGAEASMTAALAVLNKAVAAPARADLRARIIELCARLWTSIGLQTSVEKYHASGAERGAVLDFIDHPLNNRWWLEDQFAKVRALATEQEKVKRLAELAAWETPGPGSFYDCPGRLPRSPRVVKGEGEETDPLFWWWDQGRSRARLTWQVTMWPRAMSYEGLDRKARYVVRTTGYGQALLRIDGERVAPSVDGRLMEEFKEYEVPEAALRDGALVLVWDKPRGEEHLNWRQQSRLAEVWLLKR